MEPILSVLGEEEETKKHRAINDARFICCHLYCQIYLGHNRHIVVVNSFCSRWLLSSKSPSLSLVIIVVVGVSYCRRYCRR